MDWPKYASTINTVVATLAIVASGIWAVAQFRAEAENERKSQEARLVEQVRSQQFEAARPFLLRQLDLCIDASDAAAALASARDGDSIAAARNRFWQLYFGSLHIVEDLGDESVASRMFDFGEALKKAPADTEELAAMDISRRNLESPALDVGKACRALIEKSWQEVVPQFR